VFLLQEQRLMNIEESSAQLFQMSDDVWLRHANPWSVWTRYSCLPLLSLACWSREWIGWMSLVPFLIVCFWVWINPRVFRKPASTNNWASKAVFGERILLTYNKPDLPSHHLRVIGVLKIIISFGFLLTIYGLIVLHLWLVILGTITTILAKTWFLDRMVWLYQDLCIEHALYQRWVY
jgi:hypothetical protein